MKNVSKKLLNVIRSVGGKVKKSGYNGFQKYAYITEGDIIEAVRDDLLSEGLLILTSVETSTVISSAEDENRITEVKLKHTIVDTESGETIDVFSYGQGADKLDKGVFKAITGANKYFMLKTFQLSGDDDPEKDSAPAPKKSPYPAKAPATKPNLGFKTKPKEEEKVEAEAEEETPAESVAKKPSFGTKPTGLSFSSKKIEKVEEAEEETVEASEGESDSYAGEFKF